MSVTGSSTASSLLGNAIGAVKKSRWPARAARHNPVIQLPLARLARRYDDRPGERAAIRERVLTRALRQAAVTPYGAEVGPTETNDLAAWPILTKDRLKADETRFHAERRLPSVEATTGGTTGLPLRLRRSLVSLNAEQFFLDRFLAEAGVSFAASRVALLRGDDVKDPADVEAPFGRYDQGGRRLVLSSAHLNDVTVAWYAEELRRFAPDFLWAYPSTLSSLLRLLDGAGTELAIPLVVTSSETLFPNEAAMATDRFGARVIDYYGQAERVALAVDTGSGYRFDPLYGTVELVAEPEDEAADGGLEDEDGLASAQIIGTGHWNSAMPLVRCGTGDLIRFRPSGQSDQLARIATGAEPFAGIKGRSSDYLVSPDGGVLVGIDHLPRGLVDVVRMQVRQPTATEVEILLVTSGGDLSEADRRTLDASIGRKLPPSMSVDVQVVDRLARTAAGKTPFVVRSPDLG